MELIATSSKPNARRHGELAGAWLASHRSAHTVRAYRRDLQELFTFLDEWGVDALTAQRRHLDAWRIQLTGEASTVARKLAAASSFYRYAVAADAAVTNPVALVARPRVDADHSSTSGMTRAQAQDFLDAARGEAPRTRALASTLLFTGMRLGEALGADLSDLQHDAGHRVLVVTRKGGKRQKVVLPAQAITALSDYLGRAAADGVEVTQIGTEPGYRAPLFTTSTGRRLAPSEAYRTIRRLAMKAGVPGVLSPHSLRHTHATLALDAGVTLADLQDSLGQSDPRTTRRYDRARGRLERASSHAIALVLR